LAHVRIRSRITEIWPTLDQDQVIEAFKPMGESVDTAKAWLMEHGISRYTHSDNKQWIAFDTTASKAEELFQTKYFEHQDASGRTLASCDAYHLPANVSAHVDYITPGVKASDVTGRTRRSQFPERVRSGGRLGKRLRPPKFPFPPNATDISRCDQMISPACIRALYGIPETDPSRPVNPNNSLGIFSELSQCMQTSLHPASQ
jgi:tripeptidyl-peptidase-1